MESLTLPSAGELHQMENMGWVSKARAIQSYADTNDTQKVYEASFLVFIS